MGEGAIAAVVQVAIALIASGLMVKMLTVRQDRRKIVGDANASEANAASTLSGAALQMVESANQTAREAEAKASKCRNENARLWSSLNKTQWKVHYLEEREHQLEALLRERGIEVPDTGRREAHELPDTPPPSNTPLI